MKGKKMLMMKEDNEQ